MSWVLPIQACAAAASAQISPTLATSLPAQPLMLNLAASPASKSAVFSGMPYTLLAEGVVVRRGVIDGTGQIPIDHRVTTREYLLELANGVT
ncbi:hypothetical protein [Burkholderia sp. 22PA0106]|uniref:hypothetical protein n=1 Tax=Burkholderia sp. 22PA0106 TaxID=3237371 RepID=UPI0039C05D25